MVSPSNSASVTGGPQTEGPPERTAPSERRLPTIPERVGRYEILGTLGQGGMGVVLRAHDPSLDREVAVKLLHARLHRVGTQRMQREAQALARLSHPNVVDVYDVGIEDGQVFIAMEYVRGQPLHRWLRDRPSLGEIVDAFVQAGHGLVAAHEAGLVHRDFKPANVLRGDDGGVRVVDFGLAAPPRDEDRTVESGEGHVLDVRMTLTGHAVGTPAYMSPEAHRGQLVDARSDQWSFCVSLFEAIYGERPFPAVTLADLVDQVLREPTRLPSEVVVPARVRRVMLRGLAKAPERRYPSMSALLEQLAPSRRWWWQGPAAAAVVLAGVGGAALALAPPEDDACERVVAAVTEVWSDDVRAEAHASFQATGLSFAEQTWQRVAPELDDRAAALAEARRQACEASPAEPTEAGSRDRRVACLGRRLSELRGVIEVLRQAEPAVVRNAVQVVGELRGLDACEVEAPSDERRPPPAIADEVARIDGDMARVRALSRAGSYDQAKAEAERIVAEAAALAYPPLQAEATLLHSSVLEVTGEYEAAEAALLEARQLAQAAGHDGVVATASAGLAFLVGVHLRRPDDAERWVRHAQAAIDRLAEPDDARSDLEAKLGALKKASGDFEASREHFERALASVQPRLGPRHIRTLGVRNDVALAHHHLGDNERARELMMQVLADRIEVYGDAHPQVSAAYANLGIIEQTLGDLEAAVEHTQRSLDITEAALGVEHPDYPRVLTNLANTLFLMGRLPEALQQYRRSQELLERSLGPRDFLVGRALGNAGVTLHRMQRHEEARQAFLEAQGILEEHLRPGHPELAILRSNLAHVQRDTGRLPEALAGFDAALEQLAASFGPEHPELSYSLMGRGQTHLAAGRPQQALADFERAAALLEGGELDPEHRARVRFFLATGKWAAGEHAEARALMEQVHAQAEALRDGQSTLLPEVEQWQAEHGDEG